mmetsp:Transcript_27911/g.66471  ORF Transcript_27911/g.66471 Transcript_27911/m.66471 type:complete len:249 (+) Transcript_27911:2103-2849(+)
MIESDVLGHRKGRRVLQLRRLVQYDMSEVRGQRGWLLRVLVEIRYRMAKDIAVRVGHPPRASLLSGRRGGAFSAVGRSTRGRPLRAVDRRALGLELLVATVGLEFGDVNEVIDPPLDVGNGGLVRRESPLVVDDELERVLAALEIVNVGEVVTAAVHRYLPRPAIECPGYVHISPSVLPPKHCGDGVLFCGTYGRKIERDGRVARHVRRPVCGCHVGHLGVAACSAPPARRRPVLLLMSLHVADGGTA